MLPSALATSGSTGHKGEWKQSALLERHHVRILMPTLLARNYTGHVSLRKLHHGDRGPDHLCPQKHVPWWRIRVRLLCLRCKYNYQYRALACLTWDLSATPRRTVMRSLRSLLGLRSSRRPCWRTWLAEKRWKMIGRFGSTRRSITPDPLTIRQDHAVVQSFMAHHQGMILMAVCNYLASD